VKEREMKIAHMIKKRGDLEEEVMENDKLLAELIKENEELHMELQEQNKLIETFHSVLLYGLF
jgi:hypothetical protein